MTCNHKKVIFERGFMVCTNCGDCFGREFVSEDMDLDYKNILEEHITNSRYIGTKTEKKWSGSKKWKRLQKLDLMNDGDHIKRIVNNLREDLHSFIVNFHVPLKLELEMFEFALNTWKKVQERKWIRKLHNFVPAVFGLMMNNMELDFSNEELCEYGNIDLERFLKDVSYLYTITKKSDKNE